ncbi:NUDIX hydrolase domain-like protein [Gorgonomyces haynaldii]|nr:NUDIX hydrolase domain-like protein [Gorgonomyces haynaldii]
MQQKSLELIKQSLKSRPVVKWKYAKQPPNRASVLLPLCTVNEKPSILFTIRSGNLRSHTGEVSFPGGKQDKEDVDDIDTALRETFEEIAIHRDKIQVLGVDSSVPNYNMTTQVTPVIGYLGEIDPRKIVYSKDEVQSVFTLEIDYLLNPKHYNWDDFRRTNLRVPSWPIADNRIWGLTAYVLWKFLQESILPMKASLLPITTSHNFPMESVLQQPQPLDKHTMQIQHICNIDYEADLDDEISIHKGDVLLIQKELSNGYLYCHNQTTNQSGYIPITKQQLYEAAGVKDDKCNYL